MIKRVLFLALLLCGLNQAIAAEGAARSGRFTETLTIGELFEGAATAEVEAMGPPGYKIKFQVFVPADYDPAKPAGLMVFVSPARRAGPPRSWAEVLADRNMIWVSVRNSGNQQDTDERIIEALGSLQYAVTRYVIDARRVYLSGFSGGGRIASIMARFYPDVFNGYIYFSGVNSWGNEPPEKIDIMKTDRFVFVTGSHDFNRIGTKQVFREYEEAGFERIQLMDISGMAHRLPKAEKFDEALAFLDSFVEEPAAE